MQGSYFGVANGIRSAGLDAWIRPLDGGHHLGVYR
jgi:hypothetical protein